jgi:hypothetical protein
MRIFYNVPPKKAVITSQASDSPVCLRHLNDFEMVEELLLPQAVAKGEEGSEDLLQITRIDRAVYIYPNSMLPHASSFAAAKQFLISHYPLQVDQINIDIKRLPACFIRMNRVFKDDRLVQSFMMQEKDDEMALLSRVSYVLFYVLTAETGLQDDFHSYQYAELASYISETFEDVDDFIEIAEIAELKYSYTQGMDQIAAYFAAKFDLRLAGPMALRFFERFMPQVLTITNESMATVYRAIEDDALMLVRKFLQDRHELSEQIELILHALAQIPFGGTTISILHFAAAPSPVELEELVQFLMTQIPVHISDTANAIILAARLLYSLPAFLALLAPLNETFDDELEELESKLFIEAFSQFGPSAVFPGEEMKILLEIAGQLTAIMIEHRSK